MNKRKSEIKKIYQVKRGLSGLGLYAKEFIKKGDFIIEYVGPYLTNKQVEEKGGQYLFAVNSRYTIDGSSRQNIARYINHACVKTNCEAIQYGRRIKIFATKDISPGQELLYNYGKEFYEAYIKGRCRCEKHAAPESNKKKN